jgi:hypothetical protein
MEPELDEGPAGAETGVDSSVLDFGQKKTPEAKGFRGLCLRGLSQAYSGQLAAGDREEREAEAEEGDGRAAVRNPRS